MMRRNILLVQRLLGEARGVVIPREEIGKGVARELDSRERTVLESAAFFSGRGRVNLWLITFDVEEGSISLNTGMTELSSPSPVVSFVRDGAPRGVNTAGPKCPL